LKQLLKHIPHPGKYKATVFGMAVNDAIGLAIPLALISLPVALAVGAAMVGIVTATGLQMAPPKTDEVSQNNAAPAPKAEENPESFPRRAFNLVKTGASFLKTAVKDPDFMLPAGSIGTGALVFAQAALGIGWFASMPTAIAAAGIAACVAGAGFGLYVLYLGAAGRWRSLHSIYAKTFGKNNPMSVKKSIKGLRSTLQAHPRLKEIIKKPLVRKILKSPLKKILQGPSQKKKDMIMLAPAFPSTLFASAAALFLMGKYAISALTIGPAAIPPLLIATWWGSGPFMNLYPQIKILKRTFGKNKKTEQPANVPVPEFKLEPAVTPVPLPVKPLAEEFKTAVEAAEEAMAKVLKKKTLQGPGL
jgi:hypothetical protein